MFLYLCVMLLTVNSVISAPATTYSPINVDTATTIDSILEKSKTNEQTYDFSALKTLGKDYKKVATLGLLAGTLKTEQEMEAHITKLASDLFESENLTPEDTLKKIVELERLMDRDNKAIDILNSALDLAQNDQQESYEDYKRKLRTIVTSDIRETHPLLNINKHTRPYANYQVENDSLTQLHKDILTKVGNLKSGIGSTIGNVKTGITQHVKNIHSSVSDKASKTIQFLTGGGGSGISGTFTKAPKPDIFNKDFLTNILHKNTPVYDPNLPDSNIINIKPWSDTIKFPTDWNQLTAPITPANAYLPVEFKKSDKYVISKQRRQDDVDETDKENDNENDNEINKENDKENEIEDDNKAEESKEEKSSEKEATESDDLNESESEESSEEMAGGLVGLIASLSGGDEGSDIGALIGALSSVITNLFGPGGLDVPSLLSTGTSLIAGLLGGDDNFGKVLGGYVGTAIDGLSGGGGADNNGLFFGNLAGSLLAQLSANPEDEELPPSPKIFLENFFTGFHKSNSRTDNTATETITEKPKSGSSSDILGFITNIVSSIVAGITSTILNASLGSSSGSSQGSAELSGGSSSASSASHPQQ